MDNFTTVGNFDVVGGNLDYGREVFNAGAVYNLTEEVDLYASFSQGFTVPEIGRVLRTVGSAGASVDNIRPKAQVVDTYQVGLAGPGPMYRGYIPVL